MTSLREQKREHRARQKRVSHPLHERLIPQVEGAPEPIRVAQADAIKAVETRIDVVAKLREAQQAAREAPTRDEQAGREALAAGKSAAPKPTAQAAKDKATELRRQFELAKANEEEVLDRLDEAVARHGDEWEVTLHDELTKQAQVAVELTEQTRAAWSDLDSAFVQARWLHRHDPEHPRPLAKTPSLKVGDVEPVRMLVALTKLAAQAAARAVEGDSGRHTRAQARAERKAKRAQRVTA